MNVTVIKMSLFIFYFSFCISFYDYPAMNMVRFIGIFFISFVFLIAFCTQKQVNGIDGQQISEQHKTIIYIAILLHYILFVILVINLFFSTYKLESLIKFFSLVYLVILILFVMPYLINKIGIKLNNTLMIGSVFLAIFIAYLVRPNGYVDTGDRIGAAERLVLLYNHPNTLGIMCFLGIVLIIYNLYKNEQERFISIVIYLLLMSYFFITLYQTDARTSMYALVIFFLILGVKILMVKHTLIKIVSWTFIPIVLFMTIVIASIRLSYEQLNHILSYRFDYWNQAVSQLFSSGRLFTGEGSFINMNLGIVNAVLIDNGYIAFFYQNGFLAFMVLLALLAVLYFLLSKSISNQKDKIFMESFYLIFLFMSFFENILFNLSVLYCILVFSYIYYFIKYDNKKLYQLRREVVNKPEN